MTENSQNLPWTVSFKHHEGYTHSRKFATQVEALDYAKVLQEQNIDYTSVYEPAAVIRGLSALFPTVTDLL